MKAPESMNAELTAGRVRRRTADTRACLAIALVAGGAVAFACRPPSEPLPMVELAGETMGTTFSVKIAARLDAAARQDVEAQVRQALDAVDKAMSTYRHDSELMRFNRHPAGEPFAFEPATFSVLVRALEVAEATNGAFDPAVGPLVNAWGFGPDGDTDAPDSNALEALRARVDMRRQLRLDRVARTATKARDDVFIDLSAIAKGYAVDQVAAALAAAGLSRHLVEVGGEMRAGAAKPDGTAWRVGIERPELMHGRAQRIVPLEHLAIATSGDYRNYREVAGQRVSHLIDPRSGRPIGHRLASASVIAADCATADAWATALMVLGPEAAIAAADAYGVAALLLVRADNGRFEERPSAAFDVAPGARAEKSP